MLNTDYQEIDECSQVSEGSIYFKTMVIVLYGVGLIGLPALYLATLWLFS